MDVTEPPDRRDAERDNHENEQSRGRCRPSDPCLSCRQAHARRYATERPTRNG